MLTPEEKKELEALKAKSDLTEDEKARLAALEAKAKANDKADDGEKTYSEAYVQKLRDEAARNRIKANEAQAALADYDGVDKDEYLKLKDAAEKAEEERLKSEGDFEALRARLVEDHDKEVSAKDTEIADLKSQVEKLKVEKNDIILDNEITAQAAASEASNTKLVKMVAKEQTKVEIDDDGNVVIKVLDDKGKERIDLKTGELMTVKDLIEEMKDSQEYAMLFKGGGSGSGSGTETTFNGQNIKNPWMKETRNLTLQGQIIRKDKELARRMAAEAGIKLP